MNDLIVRLMDSEFPALLSILALIAGSLYYSIVVLPKLKRLSDLEEERPPEVLVLVEELRSDLKKVTDATQALSAKIENMNTNFDHNKDTLDDIQYSCHNTRHELADIKGRLQSIVSTISTDGRDDSGFCDLRELR